VNNHKIIFTGPVGAGKTTAITSISDIPPIRTEQEASDMTRQRKSNTTVAMDYGVIKLSDEENIHVYGTPGQERFDFMWDILTEGGMGLVILISNTNSDPYKDLEFFLNAFKQFIAATQVVIGVTKSDLSPAPSVKQYQTVLHKMGHTIPVFEVDARDRKDIALLLEALLFSLDPGVSA
jgi:uncharacterized protein